MHVSLRPNPLTQRVVPALGAALLLGYGTAITASFVRLPGSPVARVSAATAAAPDPVRTRLRNGLTLVVLPVPGSHLVRVTTAYRVGAQDDPPGRSGLSHAVEHLLFWGSQRYPRDVQFARWQAMGGAVNAYTAERETRFVGYLPASMLASYLDIEADRMTGARIDEAGWRAERPVIARELDGRAANPVTRLMAAARGALAGLPEPLDPGGTRAGIRAVTVADARAWYRRWYTASNATVTVVGDVDPKRVADLARRTVGVVRDAHPAPAHAARHAAPLARAEVAVDGTRTFGDLVYVLPGWRDPSYTDTVLLADMLVHAPYATHPPHFVFQADETRTVVHAIVAGRDAKERRAETATAVAAIAALAASGITPSRMGVSQARTSLEIAGASPLSQGGELWDVRAVDPGRFVAALQRRPATAVARTARAALAEPVTTAVARATGRAPGRAEEFERVGVAPIDPRHGVPTMSAGQALVAMPDVRKTAALPNGVRYAIVPTRERTARIIVKVDSRLTDAAFAAGGERYGPSDRRRAFDQFGMAGRVGGVSDLRFVPGDLELALGIVGDAIHHPRLRRGESGAVAPGDVSVVAFGPVSPPAVERALRAAFGAWPATAGAGRQRAAAARPAEPGEVVVRYTLPRVDSADFPAALLVADVLAGNDPMSLLNRRLRFADQLTFGVHSSITVRAQDSQLELSFAVAPARRREAIAAWRAETRRFVHDGVAPLDLRMGRSRLLAVMVLSAADDAAVAANLLGVLPTGSAAGYFPRVVNGIGAVGTASFDHSAATYFCDRCARLARAGSSGRVGTAKGA